MAQISKGDTFTDGQQVTGARLNQLVDSATLSVGAITDQINITANTVASNDSMLLYDLSVTALREASVSDVLNSNLPVTTSAITGGAGVNVVITPAATYKVDVAGAFEADSSNIVGNETVGGTLTVTGTTTLNGTAALNGTSTAVTKSANTNTTDIATTAYVVGQAGTATPVAASSTAAVGTSLRYAREDHIHPETSPVKVWFYFNTLEAYNRESAGTRATRTAGSTTCTITSNTGTIAHGLTTGDRVLFVNSSYPTIVPSAVYTVTVTTSYAFTIQTVATTALANVLCSGWASFSGTGISSVTRNTGGLSYIYTFSTALTDIKYLPIVTSSSPANNQAVMNGTLSTTTITIGDAGGTIADTVQGLLIIR